MVYCDYAPPDRRGFPVASVQGFLVTVNKHKNKNTPKRALQHKMLTVFASLFRMRKNNQIVNVDVKRGTDGRSMSLGGYRPVELEATPFSLPPPVAWVPERDSEGELVQAEGRQQGIAVWSMPFLHMF